MQETKNNNASAEELKKEVWNVVKNIPDPEIPVITIEDLGILREVIINDKNEIEIIITPTYSGCPAMDLIGWSIKTELEKNGFKDFKITNVLSPAWTTDWMTETGKQKLKAYGIAPPNKKQIVCDTELFQQDEAVPCPHCDSYNTKLVSRFGSTPCKALYHCNNCNEPFDYFKCH